MNRLRFVQVGRTLGDETTPYKVEFDSPLTVGEFMEEVLRKPEWGDIRFNGRRVSFRYGDIEEGSVDDILDMEIQKIGAVGGWSYMSYIVNI